ncbi:SDR family oxidoreductase [Stieleria varia]|uniref:3-oxoacyl-[acyl-carrier-protein] reductase FabG1 n=1 Tax=Stieleria varia TaxID=2528005 RepID=A0A5C6ASE0_9BACT|nr:SDR family oxidoreductase [Stieleria varia]TWU02337.1 3-oxoacyl-[acyl-carrier-protein] reductase FabG1 [Stieleria varia]
MSQRNVLIIGGSHGIGLGIVRRCVEQGDQVTVISRTEGELVGLSGVMHIAADVVNDEISSADLPDTIDAMAYCPGSIHLTPLRGVKADAMLEDFKLNALGAVKCIQAALPALKSVETASIVLFSTVAVTQGLPMHVAVAAAKGAVEGIAKSLAAELAPKIRVNCVAPALTDTPLAARLLSNDQKRAAMAEMYPLKRIGTVDDIAEAAFFLLSDKASWITGQVIGVDGGMSSVRA